MKDYRYQVEIPSSCDSSGDCRKSSACSSLSMTLEGLMVVPPSSSQSDELNHFSQGNPEDKRKS